MLFRPFRRSRFLLRGILLLQWSLLIGRSSLFKSFFLLRLSFLLGSCLRIFALRRFFCLGLRPGSGAGSPWFGLVLGGSVALLRVGRFSLGSSFFSVALDFAGLAALGFCSASVSAGASSAFFLLVLRRLGFSSGEEASATAGFTSAESEGAAAVAAPSCLSEAFAVRRRVVRAGFFSSGAEFLRLPLHHSCVLDFLPILEECLKATIGQRMLNHLLQHTEGNRCDIGAHSTLPG